MTLQLFLIRHGQTDFSRANRFCGAIDPPLNDVGLRMADALAAAHGDKPWTGIYSSPRTRALQTATPLARRAGVPIFIDEGLAEIAYGAWEGLGHDEVMHQHPEEYAYWSHDPASRGTPGGETAFHVAARAAPVVARIREHHASGRVLVVSHKATLRIMMCALLGLDVRLFRERMGQPVAALTCFEISSRGPSLVLHGDISHLPPDLRGLEGT
ncbi:MAG: histidine phosphatase family protein [Myxococcota bacterium]